MEEPVIGNDPQNPAVPDKGQGKDDNVNISRAELESLRRDLRETQQSERDWANMARGGRTPASEPAAEPEDALDPADYIDQETAGVEGDTPEKLVDDLAAQGAAALGKRGNITAADAQRMAVDIAAKVTRDLMGRERGKMASDAQIMGEFPELRDQKSEMWKETAKQYQAAVAMDPAAKKTPAALFLAARVARETLKAREAVGRRTRNEDDEPEYRGAREPEDDRRRRADSQDARPRGRAAVDDVDDMLGAEARQVIRGFGITEAEFNASRREAGADQRRKR
jgi:hypothetical protein